MQEATVTSLNLLNMVAYIANIGLVMGIPSLFHLPDNAEISARYQTIVTPAGFAFAIWGIIFTMQAVWATIQLVLPSFRSNPLVVKGVAYNYIAVCAVQVAWSFSFALDQIVMSCLWMTAILYFLVKIYVGIQNVMTEYDNFNSSFWLLRFPFVLHLGWIVAATLVNFNVLLVAHGGAASTQFSAAIVTLSVALIVGAGALFLQRDKTMPDVTIALVLVWALNAISKELKNPKELITTTFSEEQIGVIQNGSGLAAGVLLVGSLAMVARALWKAYKGDSVEEVSLLDN